MSIIYVLRAIQTKTTPILLLGFVCDEGVTKIAVSRKHAGYAQRIINCFSPMNRFCQVCFTKKKKNTETRIPAILVTTH